MPRPKRGRLARKKPQKYDTSFKDWVEQQAHNILPLLLPGAVYEKTLTVEIIRSVMRADKVFKILYCGEEHILHLEFETGFDSNLRSRLLVYNSGPRVKKMKEQARKEVEQAREQTQIETLRRALVSFVHARFPDLTAFAQQQVESFAEPVALDLLIQKIAVAPDAKTARWLLDSSSEV